MARRARLSTVENEDQDAETNTTATRRGRGRVDSESLSPSPAASFSSDKENRHAASEKSRQAKGKGKAMAASQLPTPETEGPRSSKKRKLGEREGLNATQTTHAKQLAEAADKDFYDPEQSIEERRAVRKDFRDLSRELTGMQLSFVGIENNANVI